ncbi:MAG: radical SAM family heme chaperone HemW [Proteobacteria bacterium]|nr:radical SAM family heme chaperone HemW [Pseudomonadota bacterium]
MDTSVYVHFPWCVQKCPYCDFASQSLARGQPPGHHYADAVLRELDWRAGALPGRRLSSVFFGGGTPSLWAPAQLGRVLRGIRAAFEEHVPCLEVSVECNPTSLGRRAAAALREVGVNRLSIGVQSLDDDELRFLGRLHDSAGALHALDAAVLELPRVSADMMFGLPEQTPASFCAQLERVLACGVGHVSCYALTVEPSTRFGALQRQGRLPLAPERAVVDTFRATERLLEQAGLAHYEVSNYARAGQHARHNEHYWRGGSYLGLGAAAVGCLGHGAAAARRYRNQPDPTRYMRCSRLSQLEVFEERLGCPELIREAWMLGLRTSHGVHIDTLRARLGVDPLLGRERALRRLGKRGDLELVEGHLRVPAQRWLWLDGITSELF